MDDEIEDKRQCDKDYHEGGWGWVVCVASFMASFIVFGVHSSFGVIYSSLVNDLNLGKAESAWVGSVAGSLNFLCGPVASYLCKSYGCRRIALMGAFLSILGLFLTSFVKESAKMYLTYGILWGVGSGLSFLPSVVVLGQYFHRRFPMAVSISSSGSGIGGLLSAPFMNFLLRKTGWKNTMRILASCTVVLFICAFLYRPRLTGILQDCSTEERNDRNDKAKKGHKESYLALLKIKPYIALVVAVSIFQFCYTVPYVHLFEFSQTVGISSSKGSWLLGILSIASTLGKMIFGQVSQLQFLQKSRIHLLQLAVFVMGLATVLCPLVTNYTGLLCYVLVYGTFDGCFVCQLPVVISEIIGHSRFTEGLGVVFGVMAIPMNFGPPIAGWLYQAFGDYSGAFYMAGSFAITTSLIMFTIPCLQHRQKQPDKKQLTQDVTQQLVTQNDVTQHLVTQDDVPQQLVTQNDVMQHLVTQDVTQPIVYQDSVTQQSTLQLNVKHDRDVVYKRYLKSGRVINVYHTIELTEKEKDGNDIQQVFKHKGDTFIRASISSDD